MIKKKKKRDINYVQISFYNKPRNKPEKLHMVVMGLYLSNIINDLSLIEIENNTLTKNYNKRSNKNIYIY